MNFRKYKEYRYSLYFRKFIGFKDMSISSAVWKQRLHGRWRRKAKHFFQRLLYQHSSLEALAAILCPNHFTVSSEPETDAHQQYYSWHELVPLRSQCGNVEGTRHAAFGRLTELTISFTLVSSQKKICWIVDTYLIHVANVYNARFTSRT